MIFDQLNTQMIASIISFIKLNIKYDHHKKYTDIKLSLGSILNCNCNNEFKSKMSLFYSMLSWMDIFKIVRVIFACFAIVSVVGKRLPYKDMINSKVKHLKNQRFVTKIQMSSDL